MKVVDEYLPMEYFNLDRAAKDTMFTESFAVLVNSLHLKVDKRRCKPLIDQFYPSLYENYLTPSKRQRISDVEGNDNVIQIESFDI